MPKKLKGKKGKKGKKKSVKKSADVEPGPVDPMAPSYVPPPPKPGDQVYIILVRWMDELGFYVPSTVFQSFRDDGKVNMKGSVQ